MTNQPIDPDLAARLRELSERRIEARIQAARQRADQRRQTRAEFGRRRRYGLEERHTLREARLRFTQRHQEGQ